MSAPKEAEGLDAAMTPGAWELGIRDAIARAIVDQAGRTDTPSLLKAVVAEQAKLLTIIDDLRALAALRAVPDSQNETEGAAHNSVGAEVPKPHMFADEVAPDSQRSRREPVDHKEASPANSDAGAGGADVDGLDLEAIKERNKKAITAILGARKPTQAEEDRAALIAEIERLRRSPLPVRDPNETDTRITYVEVCERGLTREAIAILRVHGAVRDEVATGWRTMESAPKDGTEFVMWDPIYRLCVGCWSLVGKRWYVVGEQGADPAPSHWLLPSPPGATPRAHNSTEGGEATEPHARGNRTANATVASGASASAGVPDRATPRAETEKETT